MKTAFLKHYGKIFLTILALGAGTYFHVDMGKAVDAIGKLFAEPTVSVSATPTVDAGK